MDKKHACEHCRHDNKVIRAKLGKIPHIPEWRDVPMEEYEIGVVLPRIDLAAKLDDGVAEYDPVHLPVLVWEKERPLDLGAYTWAYKFKGVRLSWVS